MSDVTDTGAMAASAGSGPATAGRKLKAAREAAGLSVDAVAQQLKLAPRQVKALEDDDWGRLPGRTFVRGFARSYARFVQLDPDAVLALLPSPESVPALERPALAASRRPIGEIPVERIAKPAAARLLLPLLLVVVVAAAAVYVVSRTPLRLPALLTGGEAVQTRTGPSVAAPAPMQGTLTTPLPNPIADTAPAGLTSDARTAAAGTPGQVAISPPVASTPAPAASESAPGASATAPAAATGSQDKTAPAPVADAGAATEAPLVLTFKGTSWAEVKDAKGRVVLQMTGGPGMTQTVSALAPLELSLGNAPEVDVTFRGRSLDLTPYTRGSVARVALK